MCSYSFHWRTGHLNLTLADYLKSRFMIIFSPDTIEILSLQLELQIEHFVLPRHIYCTVAEILSL